MPKDNGELSPRLLMRVTHQGATGLSFVLSLFCKCKEKQKLTWSLCLVSLGTDNTMNKHQPCMRKEVCCSSAEEVL